MQYALTFPSGTVEYIFQNDWNQIYQIAPPDTSIIVTDSNVQALYEDRFKDYRVLAFPAGEENKTLDTINDLTHKLIEMQAHRNTTLIGVGGGVVTDVTGFLACTYMRGVPFGFVPTTLLGMVDASIGGKNGVNIDLHKNMLGNIRQPRFILYDTTFLQSLNDDEWSNGFAELVKYGCISDSRIIDLLSNNDILYFRRRPDTLSELIGGSVDIKNKIVHADETETGLRKLLNFGHTAGHAFETLFNIPHGHGVAIGMMIACHLSEIHSDFKREDTLRIKSVLEKYQLPVYRDFEVEQVMDVLRMDKKRGSDTIDYILLHKIGVPEIKALPFEAIKIALESFKYASND